VILVAGDYMLDLWWFGEIKRISPEAPVPVFSVQAVKSQDGAAENVARNVRSLGVECRTQFGDQINKVTKIRLMAKKQHVIRADFDHPQEPIEKLDLEGVSTVILVDYGKGSLEKVSNLIQQAKNAGKTVLVDPKGYDYERYRGADVIKPNLDEMKVMVGGWKDEDDLTRKALALCKKAEIKALLLTRAADGMSLYSEIGTHHIPSVAGQVLDVTGAGETAIAALGVGLHQGFSLEESAYYANKAAGLVVGRFGPSVATREEVFGSS
jgi:rfaE bifunctional protein kinase chain/domain